MDVMLYEVFREEETEIRQLLPEHISAGFCPGTIQEKGAASPPAALISIRTQSALPAEWEDSVSGILTRSAGYDHLLTFRQKARRPIPCGYLPDYCARAVAEQAALMMMALMRKLPRQMKNMGSFDRDNITGSEVCGKNLLVVGVGRIGSQMADVGRGLGMRVKGVDIDPREKGFEYVELQKGIPWADVMMCALPLTPATEGMLGRRAFEIAKRNVVFINVARGEISPLEDLQMLLSEGKVGGAGLDVYEQEGRLANWMRNPATIPPSGKNAVKIMKALMARDDVILTPHNAFNTSEALKRKACQSVEAIIQFLNKKSFPRPVPGG